MKVYAFEALQPDTPTGQFTARIHHDGKWLLPLFSSYSEGSVRLHAQTWWEAEMAKPGRGAAPKKKPALEVVKNDVPVDDVGDVI